MKTRLTPRIALIAVIAACASASPAAASESQDASAIQHPTRTLDLLNAGTAQQSRDVRLPTATRLPQPLPSVPAPGSTGVDFPNPSLPQFPPQQLPTPQLPDASLPNGGFPANDLPVNNFDDQSFDNRDFRNQNVNNNDLYERCRRDNGLGGALIGGAIGGLAGNRIAGRGNRTAGTLLGAGVGAIAGTVIDRAERDPCDQFRQPQAQSRNADYDSYYAAYNQYVADYYAAYNAQYNAYLQAVANAKGSTSTVTVTGGCGCQQDHVTEEVIVEQPVKRIKRVPRKGKRLTR